MTSGTKQQRDPVTLLTICVLWLAMGVFVLYPIVRLLAFWRALSVLPVRSSDLFLPLR